MKAIIMGAGSGTRMFPLTHFINKHLLHLGGKPVIRIIAEKIAEVIQPDDITIICNKRDEQDYRWEFRDLPVRLHMFQGEEEKIGTARQFAATILGEPYFNRNDVFLHYGDTITDLDYRKFIEYYNEHRAKTDAVIAVTQNIKHDYSQVMLEDERVVKMEEKPNLSFPSWTGIGIFNAEKIKDEVLEFMKAKDERQEFVADVDIARDIFPQMVAKRKLFAYRYDGRWFDVGNLRSYQQLVKEFQNKPLNL